MRRRSLFHAFLVACAVWAGLSVVIHLVRNNFYIEPDSASYMSLAQNLAQGHAYLRYDREWSADWPPLVPFSLIALSLFFRDPLQAFGALAAICYAGTLLVAGRWLLSRVSWQASLAAVLLLLTALPLRKVMNSALSEPLFLFLTVSFLIQCMRYAKDASRWNLAGLAVLSALCCLTRYSGIVTLAIGGFYVWQSNQAQKIPVRFLALAVFALIAALPLFGWCWLNHHRVGVWMGDRSPASVTLAQTLGFVRNVFTDWSGGQAALALLVGMGTLGWIFLRIRAKETLSFVTPWLLFSALYLAFLVYTASHVEFDMLDNRLLSPLYIPLMMSFVTTLNLLIRQLPTVRLQRGSCVALALLLAGVVWHNQSLPLDFSDRGEYYSYTVTHSSLLLYLERHPSTDAVYSNDPGLYWFRTHRSATWVPGIDDASNPGDIHEVLEDAAPGSRLVWFLADEEKEDEEARTQVKDTLDDQADLHILAEFPDGIIFVLE